MRHLHLQLGKKGQVSSVDSIIAYLIFAMFLFYISNFVLDLGGPFTSYVQGSVYFKDLNSLKDRFYFSNIDSTTVDSICNLTLPKSRLVGSGYSVLGFYIPAYDTPYSSEGIHFNREGYGVETLFNNSGVVGLSAKIFTDGKVSLNTIGFEGDDSYNLSKREYGFYLSIHSNASYGDLDTLSLDFDKPSYIVLEQSNLSFYIGTLESNYSCNDIVLRGSSSMFSGFSDISHSGVVSTYWVRVWWN